jgi:hypothetical protein
MQQLCAWVVGYLAFVFVLCLIGAVFQLMRVPAEGTPLALVVLLLGWLAGNGFRTLYERCHPE